MSLYLKYRSQTFDDVVEQSHITTILKAHTINPPSKVNYLFYGPRGTGKTSCARIFARSLNCLTPKDGNPCLSCTNCQQTDPDHGQTFDIIEIDAASHTGVDNVREEIIEKSRYAPTGGLLKKVYIIDEVHMLSKSAFNALLKIMEEPPEYLVFILATTEIEKVPPTILSRCQIYHFQLISRPAIIAQLDMIVTKEKIDIEPSAIALLAKLSGGCMRDAIKYLDQVSLPGTTVTRETTQKLLGVANDEDIETIIGLFADASTHTAAIMEILAQLLDRGIQLDTLLDDIMISASEMTIVDSHYRQVIDFCVYVRQHKRLFPRPMLVCEAALRR